VFVAVARNGVSVGHLDGEVKEIDLFGYFKDAMNLTYKKCSGAREIASNSEKSCNFVLIMDPCCWCLTLSLGESLNIRSANV
jgi:hypothetical protein